MFLLVTTGCIYFIISLRSTEGVGSREAVSVAPRSRPLCERQASSTNSCGVVRVPSKQEKDGSERKPKDSFFERDPGGERRGLSKKKKWGRTARTITSSSCCSSVTAVSFAGPTPILAFSSLPSVSCPLARPPSTRVLRPRPATTPSHAVRDVAVTPS